MEFFYLEKRPMGTGADTEFLDEEVNEPGPAAVCPRCGEIVSMLTWSPPYVAELECWAGRFGDLAWGPGNDIIVSEHFRQGWEATGLSGLSGFEPVKVSRVKRHAKLRELPPKYFFVSVVMGGARIDTVASGYETDDPIACDTCRIPGLIKRWKRIVFEEDSWTGASIFHAWGMMSAHFVDERFKAFVEEYRISNCRLIPIEEYAHDFYPGED